MILIKSKKILFLPKSILKRVDNKKLLKIFKINSRNLKLILENPNRFSNMYNIFFPFIPDEDLEILAIAGMKY